MTESGIFFKDVWLRDHQEADDKILKQQQSSIKKIANGIIWWSCGNFINLRNNLVSPISTRVEVK